MARTPEHPRGGRADGGARRLVRGAAVLAVAVAVLAGCGGDGDDEGSPSTMSSTAPASDPPATTEATTTTRPLGEDVVEVPVSPSLADAIPVFPGRSTYSRDSRYDIRMCDGLLAESIPAAQAQATFTAGDEVTEVGVYQFPDGSAEVFLDDYTDALLECSGSEFYDEIDLGELAYGVPYDSQTSILAVLAGEVVWVVQRRVETGSPTFSDEDVFLLGQMTG